MHFDVKSFISSILAWQQVSEVPQRAGAGSGATMPRAAEVALAAWRRGKLARRRAGVFTRAWAPHHARVGETH